MTYSYTPYVAPNMRDPDIPIFPERTRSPTFEDMVMLFLYCDDIQAGDLLTIQLRRSGSWFWGNVFHLTQQIRRIIERTEILYDYLTTTFSLNGLTATMPVEVSLLIKLEVFLYRIQCGNIPKYIHTRLDESRLEEES